MNFADGENCMAASFWGECVDECDDSVKNVGCVGNNNTETSFGGNAAVMK